MFGTFFEPVVVCLREGVEIALVVGIFLAYLIRTGRGAYVRCVFFGSGAAVLASLGVGIGLWVAGVNPHHPLLEGALMLGAAGLVTSLLIWMWRTGRGIRARVEHRLDALFSQSQSQVDWKAALATFGLVFLMVFREGAETVVFLLALAGTPGTRPWVTASGIALGLGLAAAIGVLLARGSVRINLRRFFAVTGFALTLLILKLIAGALHEFFEAGMVSGHQLLEDMTDALTSRTASFFILVAIVGAPLVCLGLDWLHRQPTQLSKQPSA
jgi:high-affinity iron transporter